MTPTAGPTFTEELQTAATLLRGPDYAGHPDADILHALADILHALADILDRAAVAARFTPPPSEYIRTARAVNVTAARSRMAVT